MDLNAEKRERLKLCTAIRQLENELGQLRRQFHEPSPSSLPIPFTVDPPCSADFQDNCALHNAQFSKPSITITPKRASNATSKSPLPDHPRGLPASLPTSRPSSSDLETRVNQLEKKLQRQKRAAAKQSYPSTGPHLPFSMTDSEPWSLEAPTLSCGN